MSPKTQIVNSIKLLLAASLIAQIIRWGATLVVLRLLLPSDYGIVAIAEVVIGLLEMVSRFGLGAVIIQRQHITQQELRSVYGLVLAMNTLVCLALVFFSDFLAAFYNTPQLSAVFKVLGLGFLFYAFEVIPGAMLSREMKFKTIAVINVLCGVSGAIVSLSLAYLGWGYWALVLGGLSIQFTRALLKFCASPFMKLPLLSIDKSREYLAFGGYLMLGAICGYLVLSIDVIVAGKFWTSELLGYYSAAMMLAILPMNKILPHIKQVALPAYAKIQDDSETLVKYLSHSLRLALTLSIPVYFGVSSIAYPAIELVLGEKWRFSALPFAILCVAMPFRMVIELVNPAIVAVGSPETIFKNTLLMLAVMSPTIVLVAWMYESPAALASVWLLLYPLLSILVLKSYSNRLGIELSALLKPLATPLLNGILMFALVRLFIVSSTEFLLPWVVLVSSALLGGLAYAGLSLYTDRQMFFECKNLIFRART